MRGEIRKLSPYFLLSECESMGQFGALRPFRHSHPKHLTNQHSVHDRVGELEVPVKGVASH